MPLPQKPDHQVRGRVVMLRWEVRTKGEVREVGAVVVDNVVSIITVYSSTSLVDV